jgi:hypothetical protein
LLRTYPLLDADAIDRTAQRLLAIQGGLSIEDHMHNCRERSEQVSVRWNAGSANVAILANGIGLQ